MCLGVLCSLVDVVGYWLLLELDKWFVFWMRTSSLAQPLVRSIGCLNSGSHIGLNIQLSSCLVIVNKERFST
ncbi:MAG: hypothetical protein KKA99_04905 [Gammaproteobacteria bacterium]|nr:hypothetical protein [Gammaproteobacteria bacterium]MBU1558793.1 hypothetical protein [Gammaproteobacteria bacterium]